VPGWTGEYDWDGWVAFEDMPHAYNPEQGYIMSANHKVFIHTAQQRTRAPLRSLRAVPL
jgi:acyl-homoserine lactone acylase PvdQ